MMVRVFFSRFAVRLCASMGLLLVLWLGGGVPLSLAGATGGPQDDEAAAAIAADTEEVVVYGSRYRGKQEIEVKREADVVLDSISADDIASVPDFNMADALRRIAGVSAEFDEDEGEFISVRGIDPNLNRVTFNGMTIPSTGSFGGSGRNVNLGFLPSSSVKELEVYKTYNASIDGSAIGGYVDVKTRSAFDADDAFIVAKISGSEYWDRIPFDNDTPFRAEMTGSKVFGSSGQFGLIFTGLYSERPRDQEKFAGGPRNERSFLDTGAYPYSQGYRPPPFRYLTQLYNNDQQRFGGNGRIEFRSDDWYTYLSGYRYVQKETEVRWRNELTGYSGGDIVATSPTAGTITDVRVGVQVDDLPLKTDGRGIHFHADRLFGEDKRIDVDLGYAKQAFIHDTRQVKFTLDPDLFGSGFNRAERNRLNFRYDTSGLIPTRTAVEDPELFADPANYYSNFIQARNRRSEERIFEGKLGFDQNTASDARGLGYGAGLSYRNLKRSRDNDEWRQVTSGGRLASRQIRDGVNMEDFLTARSWQSRFQPESFIFLDPIAMRNFFAERGLVGTGEPGVALDEARSRQDDFTYEEDIQIAYGRVAYTTDWFRAGFGLRYEGTDFESIAEKNRANFVKGKYDYLLPSANFQFVLSENLKFRLGYSRTIGRPNPGDLVARFSVTEVRDLSAPDQASLGDTEVIVRRGSPDLQPRESENYDVSMEYYFLDGEGLISVAAFSKNIVNDIFGFREDGIYQGRNAIFIQRRNVANSRMEGVEFSLYAGQMPFLPGYLANFGGRLNYTVLSGRMKGVPVAGEGDTTPLVVRDFKRRFRQPSSLFNASLFYNTRKFEAQITYNRRGDALRDLRLRYGEYEQLDASFKWRITKNWHLKGSARNLTGEPRIRYDENSFYTDYAFDYLLEHIRIDPSYHLSLIYYFNN